MYFYGQISILDRLQVVPAPTLISTLNQKLVHVANEPDAESSVRDVLDSLHLSELDMYTLSVSGSPGAFLSNVELRAGLRQGEEASGYQAVVLVSKILDHYVATLVPA